MRHTFGGDVASYSIDLGVDEVVTRSGDTGLPAIIAGGQLVTFWDSQTGGLQHSDLLTATTGGLGDPGGTAITQVYTSAGAAGAPPLGSIPMILGPDGVTVMWAQVEPDVSDPVVQPVTSTNDATVAVAPVTAEPGASGSAVTADATGRPATAIAPAGVGMYETPTVNTTVNTATDSARLMIVSSTAGLQLQEELDQFSDDITERIHTLEDKSVEVDGHLLVHDNQISELQARTGSSGGGITTGTTAERGTPTLGAMFMDISNNRIWIGIKRSDGPVWAPPAGSVVFKARNVIGMDFADGVYLPVPFDTVDFDLLAGWKDTTPTRYIPTVPGYYRLDGAISFGGNTQANPRSVRYVQWRINAVVPPSSTAVYTGSTSYTVVCPARSYSFYFNGKTDYVELVGHHNADLELSTAVTSFGYPGINITYQGGFGDAD